MIFIFLTYGFYVTHDDKIFKIMRKLLNIHSKMITTWFGSEVNKYNQR